MKTISADGGKSLRLTDVDAFNVNWEGVGGSVFSFIICMDVL